MNRLGMWSAFGLFAVGVLYMITVAIGMYVFGFTMPITGPILALMEIFTLVAGPLLVILMSTVYLSASIDCKAVSLIALGFSILVAGLTGTVHFVGLTALRQTGVEGIAWPSAIYAIELLAWDVFLGISLLFSAQAFKGDGLGRKIRVALTIVGVLCVAGTLGPATGDMRLQFIAVLGYGVILPGAWLMIALHFRQLDKAGSGHRS